MVLTTALTTLVLAYYVLSGRAVVRLAGERLRWKLFADILRVGGVGTVSTFQTTLTIALTTALVGAAVGPDAVAGCGTDVNPSRDARLCYGVLSDTSDLMSSKTRLRTEGSVIR